MSKPSRKKCAEVERKYDMKHNDRFATRNRIPSFTGALCAETTIDALARTYAEKVSGKFNLIRGRDNFTEFATCSSKMTAKRHATMFGFDRPVPREYRSPFSDGSSSSTVTSKEKKERYVCGSRKW